MNVNEEIKLRTEEVVAETIRHLSAVEIMEWALADTPNGKGKQWKGSESIYGSPLNVDDWHPDDDRNHSRLVVDTAVANGVSTGLMHQCLLNEMIAEPLWVNASPMQETIATLLAARITRAPKELVPPESFDTRPLDPTPHDEIYGYKSGERESGYH